MGAVVEMVIDKRATIGISGSLPLLPPDLESEHLLDIDLVTVVGSSSRLAQIEAPVPLAALAMEMQLVLTDRSPLTKGRDFGVLGELTWRLADLGAKHAFLRAGLGWGHMPRKMVEADIANGSLIPITIEGSSGSFGRMPMRAIFRPDVAPGKAGRWLIERLRNGKPPMSKRKQ